jgi:hypothetical protein
VRPSFLSRVRWSHGGVVAALYVVVAVVMTWPVVLTLGTRLASDVGDPAFVCWVLAWDAGQMIAALHGDVHALANYWNGNIFYPERLTLTYSEHFTGQALQILPLYAATGNILTAYNTLFISTFVLSGLAVYLLVRDLTGRPLAGFLGGLAFAYAPYRMGQFSHLQVLSSGWMAFALVGFHRFFARTTAGAAARPRRLALAAGVSALVMQNLSCGYFMMFFAPFVVAYCVYEIVQRRLIRCWTVWAELAIAAGFVALLSWPFQRPYLELRELQGMGVRSVDEIVSFSADVHAFATVASGTHLFGERIRAFFKSEGEGFPGFTIIAFALLAIVPGVWRFVRGLPWSRMSDRSAILTAVTGIVLAASSTALVWFFVFGHVAFTTGSTTVVIHDINATLAVFGMSLAAWLVLTSAARWRDARVTPTALGYFGLALLGAAFLALGPRIEAMGHAMGVGPYTVFLKYVPGWEGLRVPARYLMLVTLFFSVLSGLGAARLLASRRTRLAAAIVLAGCFGVVAEAWVAPVPTNLPVGPGDGLTMPPPIESGRRISPIYRVVRDLPGHVVLVEFPFGDRAYELLAVYYAGYHRRPILNGYSGYFPRSYEDRLGPLGDVLDRPDEAAAVLAESGVTHVLVHERAFQHGDGEAIGRWLESLGARRVTADGGDVLYVLPTPGAPASRPDR